MTKTEFVKALRKKLSGLPHGEIEGYIDYYSEMIDDRIEEGLSEQEAVSAIGDTDEVAKQILNETPIEKHNPRRLQIWQIVLIILCSPIWLSLLVSVISVVFSVYCSIWAAVISLYATVFSLWAYSVYSLFSIFTYIYAANIAGIVFGFGGCLLCAGAGTLLFIGLNKLSKLIVSLTKRAFFAIKAAFCRKEEKE